MLGLILLLQTLTMAVSGPATSSEYLPIRVAEAEGYFAREGLEVTVRTTRAESGAAEALAEGQVDLTATTLEALLRFGPRAPGQPARLVFGLPAAPPFAVLVASGHMGAVRSVESLGGLRVGVTTPGAPELAWFGWLLARVGVSIAQLHLMSLGGRGLLGAIDSGEIHAALVPEPMATRLLEEGRARVSAPRRARLGRGASADDRDHPRPHAPARNHEDPAPRGDASPGAPSEGDHGPAGSLTGTPSSARRPRVSSTGSPTTLV